MDADQLIEFDFETLARLKAGALNRMLKKLLLNVKQDMENRPSEKRERSINIKLKLRPKTVLEQNPLTDREEDVLTGAGLRIEWGVSIPTRRTEDMDLGFGMDGEMLINPHNLHDHRQRTFPAMEVEQPPDTLSMRNADVRDVPPDRRSAAAGPA